MLVKAYDGVFRNEHFCSDFVPFLNANLQLHFCSDICFENPRIDRTKQIEPATSIEPGKCRLNPLMKFLQLSSVPFFFCSFFTNLHFHCCSALIAFIFIIIVSQHFCHVYLQNFTQHHKTTAAKTKKR